MLSNSHTALLFWLSDGIKTHECVLLMQMTDLHPNLQGWLAGEGIPELTSLHKNVIAQVVVSQLDTYVTGGLVGDGLWEPSLVFSNFATGGTLNTTRTSAVITCPLYELAVQICVIFGLILRIDDGWLCLAAKLDEDQKLAHPQAPVVVGIPSTIVEFVINNRLQLKELDLLVYEELDTLVRRGSGTRDHLRELHRTEQVVTKRLVAISNDALPSNTTINTVSLTDGVSLVTVGKRSRPVDIMFKAIESNGDEFLDQACKEILVTLSQGPPVTVLIIV
ncbi:hypothetical protein BDW69DRAFT_184226 [Aspergillus filifer]